MRAAILPLCLCIAIIAPAFSTAEVPPPESPTDEELVPLFPPSPKPAPNESTAPADLADPDLTPDAEAAPSPSPTQEGTPALAETAPPPSPTPALPPPLAPGPAATIHTASLRLRSFTPEATMEKIVAIIAEHNGYAQSSSNLEADFRVPAAALPQVIQQVRQVAEVFDERLTSEDVALELAAAAGRLSELEASRQRVIGMLNLSNDVADSLRIEQELAEITTQLEQVQGRQRYLDNRLRLAPLQISVSMQPRPYVERPQKRSPFPWVQTYGVHTLLQHREDGRY